MCDDGMDMMPGMGPGEETETWGRALGIFSCVLFVFSVSVLCFLIGDSRENLRSEARAIVADPGAWVARKGGPDPFAVISGEIVKLDHHRRVPANAADRALFQDAVDALICEQANLADGTGRPCGARGRSRDAPSGVVP